MNGRTCMTSKNSRETTAVRAIVGSVPPIAGTSPHQLNFAIDAKLCVRACQSSKFIPETFVRVFLSLNW